MRDERETAHRCVCSRTVETVLGDRRQGHAERDAAKKANRLPKQLTTPDPVDVLVQDEQRKVRDKVQLTLEELDKGKRPETNNFRQARLGVLLMSIEGLALTLKLNSEQEQLSARGKWSWPHPSCR